MPGVKALRRLYAGKEASTDQGTAVAATAALRFEGVWKDETEVVFPPEDIGYLGGRDRAYIPSVFASLAMSGPATFEQLPYVLEAGVKAVTPTTDSGSGYIYTYALPTTAQNTPSSYTIEAGDDQQEEEASYAFIREFTLSGKAKEAWQLSATWNGRQVSASSFTPSTDITVTNVEEMLFQKSKLYIDNDTDAAGTTQKSNTLLDAELKVTSGFIPVWTGDGNLYYSLVKQGAPEVVLTITFEHDSSATAEKTAWRAKTARLIRLLIQGSTLTSAGTYTVKTCIIDLPGKWESFDVLGEVDGNDVVKGVFRSRYNANAATAGQIIVVSELVSLP
jgi:hypothetical protein